MVHFHTDCIFWCDFLSLGLESIFFFSSKSHFVCATLSLRFLKTSRFLLAVLANHFNSILCKSELKNHVCTCSSVCRSNVCHDILHTWLSPRPLSDPRSSFPWDYGGLLWFLSYFNLCNFCPFSFSKYTMLKSKKLFHGIDRVLNFGWIWCISQNRAEAIKQSNCWTSNW